LSPFSASFSESVSFAPDSNSKHLLAFADPLLTARSILSGLAAANSPRSKSASLFANLLFCVRMEAN